LPHPIQDGRKVLTEALQTKSRLLQRLETENILAQQSFIPKQKDGLVFHFSLKYETEVNKEILVTGTHLQLGNWHLENALKMTYDEDEKIWRAKIKIVPPTNFKYKYVIVDKGNISKDPIWESGADRSVTFGSNVFGILGVIDNWRPDITVYVGDL